MKAGGPIEKGQDFNPGPFFYRAHGAWWVRLKRSIDFQVDHDWPLVTSSAFFKFTSGASLPGP
jgi:hypothetical protein